jgi:hypothetical protein
MLQRLVNLVALVQAIMATDPDNYDEITVKVKEYDTAKEEIAQFHGDDALAHPQAIAALDSLVKTARAASVDLNEVDTIVRDQDEAAAPASEETGESEQK